MKKLIVSFGLLLGLIFTVAQAPASSWIFVKSSGGGGSSLLTGLVSYWNFDEASGTRVDQLGTNDLSIVSGESSTTGKISNAVDLPNHAYVSAANNASQSPSGSFTFAGWVQFKAITGSQPWIFANFDNSGNNRGVFCTVRTGPVELQLSSDGTNPIFATASTFGNVSTNTWYFIQTGLDTGNSQGFISINGGTIDTVSFSGAQHATNQPFYFGAVGGTVSDRIWEDEWGYWSRVLTSLEISTLYKSGSGTTYPTFSLNNVLPFMPKSTYAAKIQQSPFVLARYAR
jgi:hypothetical protein